MYWVLFIFSMFVAFLVFFGIADKMILLIPPKTADILNKIALAIAAITGIVWYDTQEVSFLFIALLAATFSSLFYTRIWTEKKKTDQK